MTATSTTHNQYRRRNRLTRVGGNITIPRGAIGITIAPVNPFGEAVQVSWLQHQDWDASEMPNEFKIESTRQDVDDESLLDVPVSAFSPCVFEPPGEDSATVYWLA